MTLPGTYAWCSAITWGKLFLFVAFSGPVGPFLLPCDLFVCCGHCLTCGHFQGLFVFFWPYLGPFSAFFAIFLPLVFLPFFLFFL